MEVVIVEVFIDKRSYRVFDQVQVERQQCPLSINLGFPRIEVCGDQDPLIKRQTKLSDSMGKFSDE